MGSVCALKCDLLIILTMRFCRITRRRNKAAEIGFIGRSPNDIAVVKIRIN